MGMRVLPTCMCVAPAGGCMRQGYPLELKFKMVVS